MSAVLEQKQPVTNLISIRAKCLEAVKKNCAIVLRRVLLRIPKMPFSQCRTEKYYVRR